MQDALGCQGKCPKCGRDDVRVLFPVLAFDTASFGVRNRFYELTDVWSSLIKSGWFQGLHIVDSAGRTFLVEGVMKLGGIGFLWGFNPLYGQRVRVALDLRRRSPDLELGEIKSRLLRTLNSWSGWKSRDDFDELVACIREAESIPRLIGALRTFV
jgi:hypothetical protein